MLAIAALLKLALFLSLPVAQRAAQDGQVRALEPMTIELASTAPVLAGHGPAHTFIHTPESPGALYLWARGREARVLLRVVGPNARLIGEDDGNGGERTSCLIVFGVEPGTPLHITVAATLPGGGGAVDVHVIPAPETGATRAAAAAVADVIRESSALHEGGDSAAAQALLGEALKGLTAVDGFRGSRAIAEASRTLGHAAYGQNAMRIAVAAWSRTHAFRAERLPADYDRLLTIKTWLADAKYRAADLRGAHELLEDVLAVRTRRFEPGTLKLRRAKANLAVLRYHLGDLEGARTLQEEVLANLVGRVDVTEREMLSCQGSLARTRFRLGDMEGARDLQETVVAARARLGTPEDIDLLRAQVDLARTRMQLGDSAGARELQEQVNTIAARVFAPDDHTLLTYKWSLATTRLVCGDLAGARTLQEEVLSTQALSQKPWDRRLAGWRVDLGKAKYMQADFQGARELLEQALDIWTAQRGSEDNSVLSVKTFLALTYRRMGEVERARTITRELLPDMRQRAARLCLESPRAAREIAQNYIDWLSVALFVGEALEPSSDLGAGILETLETIRHASIAGPGVALAIGARPELAAQQQAVASLKSSINDLTSRGPAPDQRVESWRGELVELASERDRQERKLRSALGSSAAHVGSIDIESIAAALAPGEVAVSYLRCRRRSEQDSVQTAYLPDSLFALLLHPSGRVDVVPLGLARPMEDLIGSWRAAIGKPIRDPAAAGPAADEPRSSAREMGERLRQSLLDPVLALAPDARTLHVVPDDFLYLLPFDALPLGNGVLGERYVVRTDPALVRLGQPPRETASDPRLLLVGGVDYGAALASDSDPRLGAAVPPIAATGEDTRAGTPPSGFRFLAGSLEEVHSIGKLFEDASGREPLHLSGAEATKAALYASVPGTRYLHIATHGWFAEEVFRSRLDREELDGPQRERLIRANQTVRGFAPETLCGLALSGANRGRDSVGRVPGILTAEELTILDLRSCDLAVLSACDTNVGIRRAGQGIRSLQSALHAAGARTAITSLWRMDDQATRELMVDFYGNLWQRHMGKADALWAAKMTMRERGYPASAWAGWVLTGDPD